MIEELFDKFIQYGRKISTDSRNIEPGSIFFALKGENFNGNAYAIEAINKGAAYSIVDDKSINHEKCIQVEDALTTLQKLATTYRKKSSFKVLAITGTNGKTTTKELIFTTLSESFKCSATKGNLNNHIGVPLTILSTPPDDDFLILEMGANHIGEIELLCKIAEPDFGLITNIGKAHLEGFRSFDGVIEAKSELYNFLMERNLPIFQNQEDNILSKLTKGYSNIIGYGTKKSQCYAASVSFTNRLIVEVSQDGMMKTLSSQLFGQYNVTNILTALKVCKTLNADIEKAVAAIENYTPSNNRSQIKETSSNTLIMDCYNANPTSMHAAIKSFVQIQAENKVAILGAMKELGEYSAQEHLKLVQEVVSIQNIKPLFVGLEYQGLGLQVGQWFKSIEDFIQFISSNKIKDSLILLKGSRANRLETLEKFL